MLRTAIFRHISALGHLARRTETETPSGRRMAGFTLRYLSLCHVKPNCGHEENEEISTSYVAEEALKTAKRGWS